MSIKKNLVVVTSSYPSFNNDFTGGGNFVHELCCQLKIEYNVTVLTPYLPLTEVRENIDGIDIIRFKYFYNHSYFNNGIFSAIKRKKIKILIMPFYILFAVVNLHKVIYEKRPSLIHAHWLLLSGLIVVLHNMLTFSNIKTIITCHGSDLNYFVSSPLCKIKQFIIRNSNLVTVVSKPLKRIVTGISPKLKHIPVIPMGFNINRLITNNSSTYIEKSPKVFNLLYVGRLSEEKGIWDLVKCMTLLKKFSSIRLTICGTGEIEEKLTKYSQLKKLNIDFMGYVNENIANFYNNSDLIILPSHSEGSPVVLAESFYFNKVLLVSDIPIFIDLIGSTDRGFIFEKANVNDLRNKILDIKNQYDIYKGYIGIDNKEFAITNFKWENVGKKFLQEFKQLL